MSPLTTVGSVPVHLLTPSRCRLLTQASLLLLLPPELIAHFGCVGSFHFGVQVLLDLVRGEPVLLLHDVHELLLHAYARLRLLEQPTELLELLGVRLHFRVHEILKQFLVRLDPLQIATEEPNSSHVGVLDGDFPCRFHVLLLEVLRGNDQVAHFGQFGVLFVPDQFEQSAGLRVQLHHGLRTLLGLVDGRHHLLQRSRLLQGLLVRLRQRGHRLRELADAVVVRLYLHWVVTHSLLDLFRLHICLFLNLYAII